MKRYLKPPASAEDLVFTASSEWLVKWHAGHIELRHARRQGLITVDGPPALVRAMESWGGLSAFADVPPAALREGTA
jgi:hypothetical protein